MVWSSGLSFSTQVMDLYRFSSINCGSDALMDATFLICK